ncbi:MAG: LamB/YcsF family protein [Trueperaceae bacterium]|nr:LamB/YcsF family protein [Trueperaceae bacterium]
MAQRWTVDLNADAGESYGRWILGDPERLFGQVTSVNLACGSHAGDPRTIWDAVRTAKAAGNAIGAHPGFPDLMGFGRRDMELAPDELQALVIYQLGALAGFLRAEALSMRHVKAHGALYLRMARDRVVADAVASAVATFDADLPLMVLAGPGGAIMQAAAAGAGLRALREAFPDRAYLPDGTLAPRSLPGALIHDADEVAARAVAIVVHQEVPALGGGVARVEADTLCVHGDHPSAVANAESVRRALAAAGVDVRHA